MYRVEIEECINYVNKKRISNLRLLVCEYKLQKLNNGPCCVLEATKAGIRSRVG